MKNKQINKDTSFDPLQYSIANYNIIVNVSYNSRKSKNNVFTYTSLKVWYKNYYYFHLGNLFYCTHKYPL